MKRRPKSLVRFFQHLPRNGDVELTILKTHLLVEELLTRIIARAAKNPTTIEQAELTFFQKMHLARAFSNLAREEWLWNALQVLNQTRNRLAHELSATGFQKRCEDFVEIVEGSQGAPTDELLSPTFGRLHWATFKVFIGLATYADFQASSLRTPTLLTGRIEPTP